MEGDLLTQVGKYVVGILGGGQLAKWIFEPLQQERITKAKARGDAYKQLLDAQNQRLVKSIELGEARLNNGKIEKIPQLKKQYSEENQLSPSISEEGWLSTLSDTVQTYNEKVETQKFVNLLKIAKHASVYASEDTGKTTFTFKENIDEQFLWDWRKHAENILDEEMQDFWARLLVEEIKSPNRFSPRTLQQLSLISTEEANLVEKLSPFIIENMYVSPVYDDFRHNLRNLDLPSNDDLLNLRSMGVLRTAIQSNETPLDVYNDSVKTMGQAIELSGIHNSKIILNYGALPHHGFEFARGHKLTSFGQEIIQLSSKAISIENVKRVFDINDHYHRRLKFFKIFNSFGQICDEQNYQSELSFGNLYFLPKKTGLQPADNGRPSHIVLGISNSGNGSASNVSIIANYQGTQISSETIRSVSPTPWTNKGSYFVLRDFFSQFGVPKMNETFALKISYTQTDGTRKELSVVRKFSGEWTD